MIIRVIASIAIIAIVSYLLCLIWKSPPPVGHNIVLGKGAGKFITTESFQFIIKLHEDEPQKQTTLTLAEYRVINKVIRRMWEIDY